MLVYKIEGPEKYQIDMFLAPFVTGKATSAFSRDTQTYDTTIGWRFVNKKLDKMYGSEGMIQTAQNIATDFNISRETYKTI